MFTLYKYLSTIVLIKLPNSRLNYKFEKKNAFSIKKLRFFHFPRFRALNCHCGISSMSWVWIFTGTTTRGSSIRESLIGRWETVLKRMRRFFAPELLCLLIEIQVRSFLECCFYLCDGTAIESFFFDNLDWLQPLQLRKDVASTAVFYRLYNGKCSEVLFQLMPPSSFLYNTTHASLGSHRLRVVEICS